MAKGQNLGAGLIDPRYCCCAVPLVNAGIYAVILEQGIVSLAIGITSIAAPAVVAASYPSFGTYIFAATCILVAVCQPVGFIGVLREKTSTFKVYAWLNALALAAAFSAAAALIATSAARHNTAVADCTTDYYTASSNSTSTLAGASSDALAVEAEKICPPLIWAQVGIMGGLWLILLVVQLYFIHLTRTYSKSQVSDHKLYHSVYSENPEAFTMSVLRSSRYNPGSIYNTPAARGDDAWDARPSVESLRDDTHAPHRPSGLRNQSYYEEGGQGQYDDAYAEGSHAYPNTYEGYAEHQGGVYGQHGAAPPYVGGGEYGHQAGYSYAGEQGYAGPGYVNAPEHARARDAGDTPVLNQYGDEHGSGTGWNAHHENLRRPDEVQGHPAEGMFGRKSPRIG